MTIQIAVDPGSRTGWVIFGEGKMLMYGTMHASALKTESARVKRQGERWLSFLSHIEKPVTAVCVEDFETYVRPNASVGFNLSRCLMTCQAYTDAIISACREYGVEPIRLKMGKGGKKKAFMLAQQYGIPVTKPHVHDALLLGALAGFLK